MKYSLYLFVLFVFANSSFADPVELSYDSGATQGYFENLDHSNLEGVCFTPSHPCTLLSVRFKVRGTGEFELHFWEDNGAHEPDQYTDIVDPITIEIEDNSRDWITVDLSEHQIILNPPRDFQIGHQCSDDGPHLYVDDADVGYQQRGHLWTYNNGLRRELWHTINANYVLRATVSYFDELDDFTFRDISEDAGIGGISKSAWGDYDNDGWEDLLVNGRILYKNNGNGTFENVSADAGIANGNPSHTGTWGDFDNDGWLDFYALNSGNDTEDRLYRNNGDGTFEFVNDTYRINHGNNPTAACGWADADNDGFLDLWIANSEYWNDGNPQYFRDYFFNFNPEFEIFLDMTPDDYNRRQYYGRSVSWCDFDMDDDMDLYLSNYRLQPNFLFVNEGELEFSEEGEDRGVRGYNNGGTYGHTIGSSWGDIDNDGDFDLIVGNFAHPWGLPSQDMVMLCRNSGHPDYTFEDINRNEGAGIEFCETVFCPSFGDYDNDGFLDLFISSVYDGRQPFIYKNNGDGTAFENTNYESGFHGICYNSYGVSWCDFDHDGDLDIAIGNGGLFENTTESGNWTELILQGTSQTVNKFAFGSQAVIYSSDQQFLRQVEGGSGAESSQNAMTLHFGLGEVNRIDSLVVNWMGGGVDRYYDLRVNRRWNVVEGEELAVAPVNPGEINLPSHFELTNPYPNPFNSSITISFNLNYASSVTIDIFDMGGRKIEMLADQDYSVGNHSLTWNASQLGSGNYLIQARHSGGIVSRMIVLIK